MAGCAGTHAGAAYFGVPPSGRPIRLTSCDIVQVHDGPIAAQWREVDVAGLTVHVKGS